MLYEFTTKSGTVFTKEFSGDGDAFSFLAECSDDGSTGIRQIREGNYYEYQEDVEGGRYLDGWYPISHAEYQYRELAAKVKEYLSYASADGKMDRRFLRKELAALLGMKTEDGIEILP